MEVFGYCHSCGKQFDAHWHNYPDLSTSEAIMNPYCIYCKSSDVHTSTDESGDYGPDDVPKIEYEEDE